MRDLKLLLPLAKLTCVMLLLAWPWPGVREGFAHVYCEVANATLGDLRFGDGGKLQMTATDSAHGPVSTQRFDYDSVLELSAAGRTGTLPLGMSLRKDLFLPLCVFLAVTAAVPTSRKQKAYACLLGLPILSVLWLAFIGVTGLWGFSSIPGLLTLAPWNLTLLDAVVAVLLVPPGNRFLVPLLLAGTIAFSQRSRGASALR